MDGCRFGLKHPKTGKLLRKSWGFFATKMAVKRKLHVNCNHLKEDHSPIEGNVTSLTATYSRQLCKALVKAMQNDDEEYTNLCQMAATLEQEWVLGNGNGNEDLNEETEMADMVKT